MNCLRQSVAERLTNRLTSNPRMRLFLTFNTISRKAFPFPTPLLIPFHSKLLFRYLARKPGNGWLLDITLVNLLNIFKINN